MQRLPATLLLSLLVVPAASAAAPSRPNVVVVLVDALRARNLGAYGNPRPTSPKFDAFAAQSVLFEDAISQSAWTAWSMPALFASLDVRAMLCDVKPQCGAGVWIAPEVETVAERFHGAGYRTAALVKTWALPEETGFAQGFDRFEIVRKSEWVAEGISGQILTDAALSYLDEQKGASDPFFLYLHYMDVHAPYRAPAPFFDQFSKGYGGPLDGTIPSMQAFLDGKAVPTAADLDRMQALYDGEIAYWDGQFGRVLDRLAANGLDKNTIVVVTADHGEGFYEHQNLSHGHVWQENIHVPLAVRVPGNKPRRVEGFVQQNSLGGTLAELAGIGMGASWMGGSLADVVRGAALTPGYVHSVMKAWRVVIDPSGLKFVAHPDGNHLYDLVADPGETTDLLASRPDDYKRLANWLRERRAKDDAVAATLSKPVDKAAEDAERKKQLEALGYVQ